MNRIDERPKLIVIAGPNGAGKSTTAPSLLHATLGVTEYVNADVIAHGLSAFAPEGAAIAAGRIMLQRIEELSARRRTFAFETTLASRSFAPWIAQRRAQGYWFHLIFLWLPSPEMAIQRVAERVQSGGHHVPDLTVRRRYHAGLRNFFLLYEPLADGWEMYDQSTRSVPDRIAARFGEHAIEVERPNIWDALKGAYRE